MLQGRIKHGGKVFRDPIHQLIRIDRDDEFILDLIDTPEFQRLRRIRQLGVSWLTYPGAEHSRFVHSLGVFNFVQRMLDSLCRRYSDHGVATYLRVNAKMVKAAALLHDIGHGPFSHMIERAFGSTTSHEAKTVSLITDRQGAIHNILNRHEIVVQDVADLIQHASKHLLLTDLVSSQLDADRMDYLLRDSYCTGVQYGLYDSEWLLNSICVGKNPLEVGGEEHNAWRLALDERRGDKAAEQFILARAHMNEQVYFHRVTRGFESLLLCLFQRAAELGERGNLPTATPSVVQRFFQNRGVLPRDDWMHFDESVLLSALHQWASGTDGCDSLLSRWSSAFLNRKRIFGCVQIGKLRTLETPKLFDALREQNLIKDQDWCVDDIESSVYKGLAYSNQSAGDNDDEESQVESILLASGKPDQKAKRIETTSELIKYLDSKSLSFKRLYFDGSKRTTVEGVIKNFKQLKIESSGEPE